MKHLLVFVTLVAAACAQETDQTTHAFAEEGFASEASFLLATYQPNSSDYSPAAMANAANTFLDGLDEQQRRQAAHRLDSPERTQWTNLPAGPDAGGLRIGACNKSQVQSLCDLLATLLSEQGYAQMCHIMLADDQLLNDGQPRPGFGTENFSVVVFGSPSPRTPWAFQLDGHHLGLNVAIQGDKMSLSPSFIGTQPEAFQIGQREIRPLSGNEDQAFELLNSLSEPQRSQAVLSSKRGNIKTGPGHDGTIPRMQGVSCASFDAPQQNLLMSLISQWVNVLPPRQADLRMRQLAEEIDEMHFAWHGPSQVESDVSYRIQGPTLIIEYACQDLGGNPLNHLHTMYRDPKNEYGRQLLIAE